MTVNLFTVMGLLLYMYWARKATAAIRS